MDDGPVKMFKILTMRLFVVLKSSVAHFLSGLWLSPYLKPTVRQESPTFIPAFFEIGHATVDETCTLNRKLFSARDRSCNPSSSFYSG